MEQPGIDYLISVQKIINYNVFLMFYFLNQLNIKGVYHDN